MEINWYLIAILAVFVLALVVYTVRQNLKEKKKLEHKLNNDFKKREPSQHNDED
ncbi:hypothetical protein ACI6PS_15315 [Flavobacterium sp. PLA-1-15]|uniref:hypothetical protein n=1 Tax=Flavobacterium sp. PLA-1-15 TaxID=3380533 RepID=UPI003B7A7EF5